MYQTPRWLTHGIVVALLGSLPLLSRAQDELTTRPLFAEDSPLILTIAGPFRTLSRDRRAREELPGTISYQNEAGQLITLDVDIRTRGNSRMDVCTFPPLRLNLRRRQVEDTLFAGQNQLKLVTLCKDLADYREYLALEHELYRVFNLLTNVSYRVRWAEVEYLETDSRGGSSQVRSAFFIEEDSEVAERNGMESWNVDVLEVSEHEPRALALMSLFEYMIGNTDWAGLRGPPGDRCCHNAEVLRDTNGLAVLLPYDFDQSGLINATYASPAADLPIRSVRQRLYRGYCAGNDALDSAFDRFIATRTEIEALLESAAVRRNTRRRVLRYVNDFYEIINDEEARRKSIFSACRG